MYYDAVLAETDALARLKLFPTAPEDFVKLPTGWHRWPEWHPRALVRALDHESWVAVIPVQASWGVITGHITQPGAFHNQWVYYSYIDALLNASHWDGDGEPAGWTAHPYTGRRRG